MPALHGCDSRVIFCTARSCTELHGPTRCTELHGPASHCGCTALHGPPSNGSCTALHGRAAARALPSIIQPTAPPSYREIYLTATVTTDLEVHGPPCTCTALHGLEDQLCCTELHGPPCEPPLHGVARTGRNSTMHGIARIPCSCLVIFSWLHCTARQLPDIYIYVYIYTSKPPRGNRNR